jgi:hypothetical protein
MLSNESVFTEAVGNGPSEWKGTERYDLIGRLGGGGMGVVYEAFDKERGQTIAVKTLLRFNPAALYQFKQEFRTLADVRHDNLVRFYEFVLEDGGNVFFTMELVRGADFLQYVGNGARRSSILVPAPRLGAATSEPARGGDVGRAKAASSPASMRTTPVDIERLRGALRQLVDGICVLHTAGKLHRDIKPSNVLVTAEGRVVLLDFGVATELRARSQDLATGSDGIVGTARYLAPEQAEDSPLSPASDWYSVGVMLYEALVGRPPFEGTVMEVLTQKNTVEAPAPSSCVAGVPADLNDLCVAMLRSDPSLRPTGAEIARRLGVVRSSLRPPRPTIAGGEEIVGREPQLGALLDAFEATRAGDSMTVRVSGAPGMGKSAVVRHFLDDLEARGEAHVLRGRAYEREAVPYKGVDSIIDALTRYFTTAVEDESMIDLPADAWALARLFPVLRQVPGIGEPPEGDVGGPQEVRRLAIESLRAIFRSLSERQPVVVFLDDAQWADVDSAILVAELMRTPHAPPLLFIMTFREGEEATSTFLAELAKRWPKQAALRDLDVGPLSPEDGVRLALRLLNGTDEIAQRVAVAVAREARGSPFLIEELARGNQGQASPSGSTLAVLTLEQMVGERLDRLSEGARSVMEMVAIEGRPVQVALLAQAAGIDAIDSAFNILAARRFVHTGLRGGQEVVESVHARIRETIVARLPAARLREHHLHLAQALEHLSSADAEAIAMHWLGAGDGVRAARFAETAAEQATVKLAFDRSARLIRFALEHVPPGAEDASRLQKRLAEVLGWAGRPYDSAQAYIGAADSAPAAERVELRRAAAEQLVLSGHIVEGTEMLHGVLDAAGMSAPRTPIAAMFWLIVYSLWLKVIGLRFKERKVDDISQEDKLRVDALFTVAMGFSLVDSILGACMQARHLIEALRVGEPLRMLRAATLQASHYAATGKPPTDRERKLLEIAQSLAKRLARPESDALFNGLRGIGEFHRGHWILAAEFLERAEKAPHEYSGSAYNRVYHIYSYSLQGDMKETAKRSAILVQRARDRGELYTTANLGTTVLVGAAIAANDPEGARRSIQDALADWPRDRFLVPHYQAMVFGGEIDLYNGEGAQGYDRFLERLPALKKSMFLYSGMVRAMSRFGQAKLAIAASATRPERRAEYIADARRIAKLLNDEYEPWVGCLAALLDACIENAEGDRAAAVASLRLAIERMDRTQTGQHRPVAQYRLGQLLEGAEGQQALESAMAEMKDRGIVDPARYAAVHAPGTWGPSM